MLEAKAMSSQLFKELADKGTVEKLETALSLSNILYARSRDSSSQEAFLSTIVDLLQEAIDYLKAPETPTIEHVAVKDVFVKDNGLVCICGLYQTCSYCKKYEPRTPKPEAEPQPKPKSTAWTAERRAEHSAHLKGIWAAKKAFKEMMFSSATAI